MVKFIRLPELESRCGRKRSAIYRDMGRGVMIKPVLIGLQSVGWPESEVDQILAARIASWTDDQIRVLVKRLESERKNLVPGTTA